MKEETKTKEERYTPEELKELQELSDEFGEGLNRGMKNKQQRNLMKKNREILAHKIS